MINREIIRLKTLQITYAYYQNGAENASKAEKELLFSLGKAYELYNTLLDLMVQINRLALRSYDAQLMRSHRLGEKEPNRKFVDNKFMLQLEGNHQLRDFRETQGHDWTNDEEFVRTLLNRVLESDYYLDYMANEDRSYEEDRELWRMIYRNVIVGNEELDQVLEDMSLYWNDDKQVVDSFVLKTINRFNQDSRDDQPLMPEFKSEDDQEFAQRLIAQTLRGEDYYRSLIAQSTRNWDVERVPLMDRIILQVALAEITSFPSIPLSVSINEYVELSKYYSTPNSAKYINATLDTISKKLIAEHKLVKN